MSVNLRLIPTAVKNRKEITVLRSQKNDQNSNQPINNCTVIRLCTSHNSFVQNHCSRTNVAKKIIHSSSAMNGGGVS